MMWKQKIIDIQEPSTKELMLAQNLRPEEHDAEYTSRIRLTPIDYKAQCVKEDGSVDLNVRKLSDEEAGKYEVLRRSRGGWLEYFRRDRNLLVLSEEKRERAEQAFMRKLSLDALKHKFKSIMKDLFKPSHAEVMAEALKRAKDE